MILQLLAPLYLPVLHLVTLAVLPATALYAFIGLLSAPVIIPLLILRRFVNFLIFSPLLLLTLPVSVPAGAFAAFACEAFVVAHAFFVVFTPLLWPVKFFMKWWKYTSLISQVLITDTVAPWLAPIRWTFVAALAPRALFG